MKILLLSVITLVCNNAFSQNSERVFINAANPNIQYVGRFDFTDKEQPVFMYSGSEIRTVFTGSSIQLHLKDDSLRNWFTVKLDDSLFYFEAKNANGIYPLASNLVSKKHSLSISRRTEWHGGNTRFIGFSIDAGKKLLPIKKRIRSIEFIGDSYTCGYGNEGKSREEHFTYATENNYGSFGAIVARKLNANYIGICRSGIGMYQSYGCDTNFTQPKLYDEVAMGSKVKWNYKKNQPQLVVIDLGANDLSADLDSSKYVNTYIKFVQKLRRQYPSAKIICVAGPSGAGERLIHFQHLVSAVTRHFKSIDQQVYYFTYNPIEFNGSDWHPNIKEHQQMAGELVAFVESEIKW